LNPQHSTLNNPEWCHRRLLARIHRLTLEGLRKQIEPVDVATYMRFLFRHHGFHPSTRREGAEGLYETITQLQGFDLPAGYWERDLLKYRVRDYSSTWLDELCMTGEISWGRLYPNPKPIEGKGRPLKTLSRNSLIALFRRDDAHWLLPERASLPTDNLSGVAQDLLMVLQRQGAMFAGDIEYAAQLLPTQLTDALGELISRGWITSDGFAGLRGLIGQSRNSGNVSYPRRMTGGRRPKTLAGRAGRWSLWRRDDELDDPEKMRSRVEAWAWQLLHRWGVVFRDLLEREQGAPRWYELVQCYRRLEARGEIRGGRFIRGVAGEQYASADTVGQLRKLRDENLDGEELVMLNAVDPLNLAGVLTTQTRVPALANNRVVCWRGEAVVGIQKKKFRLLKALTTENALILAKLLDFSPGEIAAARREYVKQNPAPIETFIATEKEPALF
ncbi:MAG TPA: DEAD/DEAH box helicase, partial [Planctomycetaceae bacterium]|nr:DEAD/DEAH box helicase [Planctomycetaceae bacterium]